MCPAGGAALIRGRPNWGGRCGIVYTGLKYAGFDVPRRVRSEPSGGGRVTSVYHLRSMSHNIDACLRESGALSVDDTVDAGQYPPSARCTVSIV